MKRGDPDECNGRHDKRVQLVNDKKKKNCLVLLVVTRLELLIKTSSSHFESTSCPVRIPGSNCIALGVICIFSTHQAPASLTMAALEENSNTPSVDEKDTNHGGALQARAHEDNDSGSPGPDEETVTAKEALPDARDIHGVKVCCH